MTGNSASVLVNARGVPAHDPPFRSALSAADSAEQAAAAEATFRELAAVAVLFAAFFLALFAPVVFGGRILAPGDAFLQSVPSFFAPPELWSPELGGGFPIAAEPQAETFYPPLRLLALLGTPGAWNAFVLFGYVVAATGFFAFCRRIGSDRTGAAVGSLGFSAAGFLVIHLGHVNMVQAAAWIPWMLFAAEGIVRDRGIHRRRAVVAFAAAFALSALAGHPQMLVQGGAFAAAWSLFRVAALPASDRRPALRALSLAAMLGIFGGAVQIAPTVELAQLSVRNRIPFAAFDQFRLPARELPQLLFPFLFGYDSPLWPHVPYFGTWGLTETGAYFGFTLLGGAVAAARSERRRAAAFLATAFVLALAASTGSDTPLSGLLHHVPAFRTFRCPGRHLLEASLALAALASLGVTAIGRRLASPRVILSALLLPAAIAAFVLAAPRALERMAAERGRTIRVADVAPAVLGVPLALAVVSAGALLLHRRRNPATAVLLVACAGAEAISFAAFVEWRSASPPAGRLAPPPDLRAAAGSAAPTGRAYSIRSRSRESLPGNLARLWRIPSGNLYSPLLLRRYASLLAGDDALLLPENRALDLLAVETVLLPGSEPPAGGGGDFVEIGSGSAESISWPAPPEAVDGVRITGSLAMAGSLADGTEVLEVLVDTRDGRRETRPVKAGEHLSEWAWERGDLRERTGHRLATIASTGLGVDPSVGVYRYHEYVCDLRFPAGEPSLVTVRFVGPAPVRARVRPELLAGGRVRPLGAPLDPRRWIVAAESAPEVTAVRNLRALPAAWLVGETRELPSAGISAAVRTSKLPEGAPFDPRALALVDRGGARLSAPRDFRATVEEFSAHRSSFELVVSASAPSLLVVSSVWFPGWSARVDGVRVRTGRADGLLLSVPVPAGRHRVELAYFPRIVLLGALLSGASIAGCALLLLRGRLSTPRRVVT